MVKWCRCGQKIWREDRWNGLSWVPHFYDSQEESPTCEQEITHCPRCGEWLWDGRDLLDAPPEKEEG